MVADLPIGVNDAIYFTNYDQVVPYVGGIGQAASNYIPPMQGFFVKVNTPTIGILMTFLALARSHDPDRQIRYKSDLKYEKETDSIPMVRFKFENNSDSTDLVIRFSLKATNGVDKKFDAYKLKFLYCL